MAVGVAAILSLSSVTVVAQQAAPDGVRAAFADADKNADGRINMDEYVGYMVLLFGGYDKNHDGYLVPAELPEHDPAKFKAADRDNDGRLSLGEGVAAKVIEYFEIDRDHDGVLSLEEVMAYEQARSGSK